MSELVESSVFPVLPLRDIVVFPHMIVPLFVGREKSVKALEEVMKDNKKHYAIDINSDLVIEERKKVKKT